MIPAFLRDRDKWVCWRYDERNRKATKVPIAADDPNGGYASATESINWSDYETAAQTANYYDHLDGVGYVFHVGGPITGIDLDDCRVPATGMITDDAQAIIDRLDSYTEVSPSGTGVHIYVKGDKPGDRNRSDDVEIYDGKRFFTVTGDHLDGTPKRVRSAQNGLEAVYDQYLADDDTADTDSSCPQPPVSSPSEPTNLKDRQLVEKAKNANNGGKFRQVWRGDYSHQPSHSEARLELYDYLAFWTGKDESQMWRLFQQSGLYPHPEDPGKCDRLKDQEIQKAIADTHDAYDPGYFSDDVSEDARETFEEITNEEEVATADGGRLTVSDETMCRVIHALLDLGETTTAAIEEHDVVDRSQRQVENAINDLEELGAINWRRKGRRTTYSLLR